MLFLNKFSKPSEKEKCDFERSSTHTPVSYNGKLSGKVLVLNQNYEAMSICNVQRAIILLYLGKAELIASKDSRLIRSVSLSMRFPTIVRLRIYIRVPYKKIVLSRKNILRRDLYHCQYCGRTDGALTIDHVIPKSKGGDDSWENLLTACITCNNKKGDRTPEEAKMSLIRKPAKPSHITFMKHFVGRIDDDWKPYLYMV
jgi:5-methylcytosine-specific restriction endonuclease McrA